MRRPLVSLAFGLTLGILAGGLWDFPPGAALAAASILLASAALLYIFRKPPSWTFLAACLAFSIAAAGYVRARSVEGEAGPLRRLLAEGPVILRLRGSVADRPAVTLQPPRLPGEAPRRRTEFTLKVASIRSDDEWRPANGRLRILVDGQADALGRGDAVETTLSARPPSPPANPGEYDFAGHLRREGTAGIGFVRSPDGVRAISAPKAWDAMRRLEAYRGAVLRRLERELPERPARILECLLLGEYRALSETERRAFRESGTLHFLAISGLHVGLAAGFVWIALLFLRAGVRTAAAGVLAAVLIYAALAGFQPSVLRATVMCALFCGGSLLTRKPNVPSSLALAWIIVLLIDPADLYRPGFQLSFAAVLGIWLFAPPLERGLFGVRDELDLLQAPEERPWHRSPARWTAQKLFSVSLAAWLSTLPLLAHHFGAITPLAPVASLLLLPIVWATIVIGLPGALLLPLAPLAAKFLIWPAAMGALAMEGTSGAFARVPGATINLPPPGPALMLLCALAALLAAYRARLRLRPTGVFALLALPVAAYVTLSWPAPPPQHLTVHTLAVGRGNCILLRFPDGKDLLYDAGSTDANVAERIILPALRALGVRRLDAVVLSHGDSDHVNGFQELARRMPVGRVIISPHFRAFPFSDQFYSDVLEGRRGLRVAAAGDRIDGFGETEIELLWPPRTLPPLQFSENELSLVLRARGPDGSVLLTGDFSRGAAELFLSSGGDLRADALQAPHHGLPDPSAERIAAAVRAKVVVVSGDAGTSAAYAANGANLLATEDRGMVTIEMEDGTPCVATFLPAE